MNALDPFRSLGAAWRLMKGAPLVVLVGGILLMMFGNSSGGVQFVLPQEPESPERFWEEIRERSWLIGIVLAVGGVASLLLSSWISLGHARAIEKALRAGEDDLGMVFSTGGRYGVMLLTMLLSWLIQFAAFAPLLIAWIALALFASEGRMEGAAALLIAIAAGLVWSAVLIYVHLGLMLAVPIAALESVGAGEALKRSFALANGRRWWMLLFAIVSGIFGGAGILACCVGILITGPLSLAMKIEAYLALTREDYPRWWIATGTKTASTDAGWGSQSS